jgi:DNA-binding response OmpR family regulator
VKILIVEDEPLIAFDLKDMLEEAGFAVVGLAGSVSEGLALIETCGCDFALLDVNLRGAHSGPVAEALIARGVPFVAISGYSPDQIPAPLKQARFLPKPVRAQDLLDLLRGL